MSQQPEYVIVNGEIRNVTSGIIMPSNRAFRYGDGLFESIRIVNGRPVFLESHIQRLHEGMQMLGILGAEKLELSKIKEEIHRLIEKNNHSEGARLRLTVSREDGGYYLPEGNDCSYVMELIPMIQNYYSLNQDGLSVDLYTELKKPVNKLSIYKTSNALHYVLAAMWARKNKLDDALLVNDRGNILEGSSSNLFIVCNGVLYTPALTDGCLAGVMRMQIINIALENKMKVYECSLNPQNLLVADEVFLSSATKGLVWVSSYKMKRYFNTLTRSLVEKLNDKVKQQQQITV